MLNPDPNHERPTVDNAMLEAALDLARQGFDVFPAPGTGEKKSEKAAEYSGGVRWGATNDEKQIRRDFRKWPDANIGIPTGNEFFVVDADTLEGHGVDGIAALGALQVQHGRLPETKTAITPSGGRHYYFGCPEGIMIKGSQSKIAPGVDVLGEANMVLAAPSIKPGVGQYSWLKDIEIAPAPDWLIELCKTNEAERAAYVDGDVEVEPDKVIAAFDAATNEDLNFKNWCRFAMAGWRGSAASDEAFAAFDRWSQKSTKYDSEFTKQKWWKDFYNSPPEEIKPVSLYWHADETAPGWRDKYQKEKLAKIYRETYANMNAARGGANARTAAEHIVSDTADAEQDGYDEIGDSIEPETDDEPGELEIAPAFSEEALALQFTNAHAGMLRYVAEWGKWLIFDGTKWNFDKTLKTFSIARQVCRTAANQVNKPKSLAKAIASAKTRNAVVSLASSDHRHAATTDQWDTDAWLLNTPGGVIDLRTGKLRAHRATDYMTKMTAVTPDARCSTILWRGFLKRITANDTELERFICRALGYGLTGIIREHAMFFCYGEGANGKGVLTNTVSKIFADYATASTFETFAASRAGHERHLTELADLQGARLVTVPETEKGRHWNETRIKEMTGGDKIKARFMRQDLFEFFPVLKLWFNGNHKPSLKSVSEAIKRRLYLIPFLVIIPENERDEELPNKLISEWPGILAWLIEGCLEWQHVGLAASPRTASLAWALMAATIWTPAVSLISGTCAHDDIQKRKATTPIASSRTKS
jgi:putative DNA primase/helicase